MSLRTLIAISLLIASPADLGAETRDFVRKGKPTSVYQPRTTWQQGQGYLEGHGMEAHLLASHSIGPGDFDIVAKLSIDKIDQTGAAFRLGNGWFGFDGKDGSFFTNGIPKGEKVKVLGKNNGVIEAGQPFDFAIRRRGVKVEFYIEGRRIHQAEIGRARVGEIGFQAARSVMRVQRFRASGKLKNTHRVGRLDRTLMMVLERDDQVTHAIEAGIDYLVSELRRSPLDGEFSHQASASGAMALETYALVVAGVDVAAPVIEANFDALARAIPSQGRMYDISCWAFALDAAISQREQDQMLIDPTVKPAQLLRLARRHRKDLERASELLVTSQNSTGGWRYHLASRDVDNSVTQFCALALGVCARRGLPIPDKTWQELARYMVGCQMKTGGEVEERVEPVKKPALILPEEEEEKEHARGSGVAKDGRGSLDPLFGEEAAGPWYARGWNYIKPEKGAWNMACAGVSSLQVVHHFHGRRLETQLAEQVKEGIRDGVAWICANYKEWPGFYGAYSLEKVGDLGGIKKFGEHDWHQILTDSLLESQEGEGSWKGGPHYESRRVSTAFALLILKRATAALTRNPRDVTIVTGGETAERLRDPDWIYLPSLETSIHLPSLVRTLRLRPQMRFLALLEEACSATKHLEKPRLLPYLLQVRQRVSSRGARKVIDRCFQEVRGDSWSSEDDARNWYDRWSRAVEIGTLGHIESVPELLTLASGAIDEPRIRHAAFSSALKLHCREVMPLLLEDLTHKSRELRVISFQGLRSFFSGAPPEFDPDLSGNARLVQADLIRSWVNSQL